MMNMSFNPHLGGQMPYPVSFNQSNEVLVPLPSAPPILNEYAFQCYPNVNPPPYNLSYPSINDPENYHPSFPADHLSPNLSKEQVEAWKKVVTLYSVALIKIGENGLTKVETPDFDKCQALLVRSLKAQKGLVGKALFLSSNVSYVANGALKLFSLVSLATILFPPYGVPLIFTSLFMSALMIGASKVAKLSANVLHKAGWAWTNSYLTKEDKAQIEILKKWQNVSHLSQTHSAINDYIEASLAALKIDEKNPEYSQRKEWNSHSIKLLKETEAKITEYNRFDNLLNTTLPNPYILKHLLKA